MTKKVNIIFISFLMVLGTVSGNTILAQSEDYPASYAQSPRFKALLYYTEQAEEAHIQFANDAMDFFTRLTVGDGFILESTTSLTSYDYQALKEFNIIIALNISPTEPEERKLFEKYMENGGGWLGFHAAGYNDKNSGWPWFNDFLGCGYFYCNNWPPQPALVEVDIMDSPVNKKTYLHPLLLRKLNGTNGILHHGKTPR